MSELKPAFEGKVETDFVIAERLDNRISWGLSNGFKTKSLAACACKAIRKYKEAVILKRTVVTVYNVL